MTVKELNEILDWRYAAKVFDPAKKIAGDIWDALIDSLVKAPSSFGMELWKFLDIRDVAVREQLRVASWGQPQVTDASHYVMICVRRDVKEQDCDRHIQRMCEVRGVAPDALALYKEKFTSFYQAKSPVEAVSWIDRQSYIALGFMMLAAAALDIDTCAIEGMDADQCDEILGLADSPYRCICGLALGYRELSDKYATTPKVRYSREDVVRIV